MFGILLFFSRCGAGKWCSHFSNLAACLRLWPHTSSFARRDQDLHDHTAGVVTKQLLPDKYDFINQLRRSVPEMQQPQQCTFPTLFAWWQVREKARSPARGSGPGRWLRILARALRRNAQEIRLCFRSWRCLLENKS